MNGGVRVARVFGIDIRIHASWLIILAVFAFSLATGFFPRSFAGWSTVTYWSVAVIATLLLFVSVLAHELGHSLVARRQGIEVKSITLFLLGGVANISRESETPWREALMAGVGPLVSLVVGAVSLGLAYVVDSPQQVHAVLLYLGLANISLAVFNLLPGFPLDGGRILRSLLWGLTHDFYRATRWAARVGQAFGAGFIALGVVMAFTGSAFGGIWLAFVGLMLIQISGASARQASLLASLGTSTSGAIMSAPAGWVAPYVTLSAAAHDYFGEGDARCLAVASEDADSEYGGLICGADLMRLPRDAWDAQRVRQAMVPAESLPSVDAGTPAVDLVRLMMERGADRAVVLEDGRLLGFVDHTALMRLFDRSRPRRHGSPHPTAA